MSKELTAGEIKKQALVILQYAGFEAWLNNNMRVVPGRTFTGRKGVPDIAGYEKLTAVAIYCEAKKIGDIISRDQFNFLNNLEYHNGHAYVAIQKEPVSFRPVVRLIKWADYKVEFSSKLLKYLK